MASKFTVPRLGEAENYLILRMVGCLRSIIFLTLWVAFAISCQHVRAESASSLDIPNQFSGSGSSVTIDATLSPYWDDDIQQWSAYIGALSAAYGFHPDFIAAVVKHESAIEINTIREVGMMGLLPASSGSESSQQADDQNAPPNDLRWGIAVLSYVVQQSGGDLFTALAAYHGGWRNIEGISPQQFASSVLDSYARALIAREGLSPDMANRWTIAIQVLGGNAPTDSLLVLGYRPLVGLRMLAEHTVYAFAGNGGEAYYIKAYVIPIGLSEISASAPTDGRIDQLEAPLRARLGEKTARSISENPRVLLACLPSLERLRGQVTTRWYSPSTCPANNR